MKNQKIKLLIVASDTSENQFKKISEVAKRKKIPYLNDLSEDEISQAIGIKRKIVGIINSGIADKIIEIKEEENGQ